MLVLYNWFCDKDYERYYLSFQLKLRNVDGICDAFFSTFKPIWLLQNQLETIFKTLIYQIISLTLYSDVDT